MTQIVSSDIVYLLSAPVASAGFQQTGTPGNSLGKYCATTVIGNFTDNVFTDINGVQNTADQVDYQCVFVLNNTSSGNSMLNAVAWMPTQNVVAGGANVTMALDNIGVTVKNSTIAQATSIVSSTTAPINVGTYVPPSSNSAGGIALGTIPPGYVVALWFQRTATNSPPLNNDGFNLQIDLDTNG
jgi:hypothetical protein